MPEAFTERAVTGLTPIDPMAHSGFRWENCPEGLRLHFPPPDWDRLPRVGVTRWLCRGSLGAAVTSGLLVSLGHPLGDRFSVLVVVLAVVVTVFAMMSSMDDANRKSLADRTLARLTVGPEVVTAEDRAGRRQSWPRTAIVGVVQDLQLTDSDPANAQVYYSVALTLVDGSSRFLWGRATRGGFPPPRHPPEYDESNIRAAVTWVTATVRQAIGPPAVASSG